MGFRVKGFRDLGFRDLEMSRVRDIGVKRSGQNIRPVISISVWGILQQGETDYKKNIPQIMQVTISEDFRVRSTCSEGSSFVSG